MKKKDKKKIEKIKMTTKMLEDIFENIHSSSLLVTP